MDYFIGDTHFGGENIIKFTNRKFNSSEDMNNLIIKNWNSCVTNNDRVIVVGDFFDNTDESFVKEILSQLKGDIYLVVGNHDIGYEDFYRKLGVKVIDFSIIYHDYYMVSHEPMYVSEYNLYVNIFAHVHDSPTCRSVSSRSFCVSAERIDYTPISFEEIVTKIKEYIKNH